MRRVAPLTLLALLLVPSAALGAPRWTPYDRPETNGVIVEEDVPVTMPDGVILSANVHRPDKPGRYRAVAIKKTLNSGTCLKAISKVVKHSH